MAEKKPEQARKRFEDVLAKTPNQPQALLALAELRAREGGKKEEVIELINKAVTANPTEKTPRLLLVDLYLRSKDNKLALAAAQSAVTAIPDSPEVLDALGRAQLASGDTNQALDHLQQGCGAAAIVAIAANAAGRGEYGGQGQSGGGAEPAPCARDQA